MGREAKVTQVDSLSLVGLSGNVVSVDAELDGILLSAPFQEHLVTTSQRTVQQAHLSLQRSLLQALWSTARPQANCKAPG